MSDPAAGPVADDARQSPNPRGVAGWNHRVRNLGSTGGSPPPRDAAEAPPAAAGAPSSESTDGQAKPAAPDRQESFDPKGATEPGQPKEESQLGDDNEAFEQGEARDVLTDALQTFGFRHTGVYIKTSGSIQFQGPVAGGDMTHSGAHSSSGSETVCEKVSAKMLGEINHYYVESTDYAFAADALEHKRVLLLRIRRRKGGTTTALRLLAGAKTVVRMRTERVLSTVLPTDLPEDSGVLVDGISAMQAGSLRYHDLRTIADSVEERRSRLVILIDWDVRLDAEVLRETVPFTSLPDAKAVVESHLSHVLSDVDRSADLLTNPEITRLLEGITEVSFDMQQLAELARDLGEVAGGRIELEEVGQRFTLRAQHSLRSWIDDLDESQLALVLSVATLHGMPYDLVADAAKVLEDILVGEYQDRLVKRPRQPRHKRLAAARAVLTRTMRRSRYGVSEVEVANFADSSQPAAVIQYVWHEFDTHRELLMQWLQTLAEEPEGRVRIRAAGALGFIASFSFDQVRRELIVPWAGSGNHDEREKAVAALAVPSRHPNTSAQAVNLVRDWLDGQTDTPLRRSAARALGLAVGEILPNGPYEYFEKLAEKATPGLAVAIGDSIAELMLSGDEERIDTLLDMLRRWANDAQGHRRIAGAYAFLEVASTLWTARRAEQGEEVWWPTLLLLAEGQESGRRMTNIVDLWGLALLAPRTDAFIHRVLRRWAKAAEADGEMRLAFIRMFTDVANGKPRIVNLLRYHAKTWRGKVPDAPSLAGKLLEILDVKGI